RRAVFLGDDVAAVARKPGDFRAIRLDRDLARISDQQARRALRFGFGRSDGFGVLGLCGADLHGAILSTRRWLIGPASSPCSAAASRPETFLRLRVRSASGGRTG